MKRLWAGAWLGSLLFAAAGAGADDLQWHAAAPRSAAPAPAVTLGRPVILGRPVALPPGPADRAVTQVSYQAPASLARPVVRMQSADAHSTWATGSDRAAAGGGSLFATGSTAVADARSTGLPVDLPAGPVSSDAPVLPFPTAAPSGPVVEAPPAGALPLAGPSGFAAEGGCCCAGGCDCCDCCPACCGCPCWKRIYGGAEYLLWAIRDQRFPALVTTGSPTSVSPFPPPLHASGGILGDPTTVVLFGGGGQPIHSNEFSGGRFTVGWWCDCCETKAVEFNYFFLGEKSIHFGANSGQFPVLARPFFNQNFMVEDAEFTAFPGSGRGRVDVSSDSRLWGGEANLRCRLCCDSSCCDCCGCCPMHYHLDLLGGFRYLDLTESLSIIETIQTQATRTVAGPPPLLLPAGTTVSLHDRFGTRNQFYGGQVGADFNLRLSCWSFDFLGKLALGDNHEVINIGGGQIVTPPGGAPLFFQGGLLALPSNSGRFTRNRFAVVPELGVKVGYNVTDNLRLTVGYTWIYWSSVVRPADQIDRVLDTSKIPNFLNLGTVVPSVAPSHPLPIIHQNDFWAQGVTFGVEYNY